MILPALLSAVTLIVIIIASAFETPVIIGMPAGVNTYMSLVYEEVSSPSGGLNLAATQGVLYLVLTLIMMAFYMLATRNERRFVAIAGKGHEHVLLHAPVLRWVMTAVILIYGLLAFVGPLVLTALTSFIHFYTAVDGNPFKNFTLDNYREVWLSPQVREAIVTSGVLALIIALGVVVLGGLLTFVALKTKSRFRRVCEFIAMAPIAIPAIVYSAGLLLTVLSVPGLARIAYGTRSVMVVAEVICFLPLTMRMMTSSLIQIQDDLLDASLLSGASTLRTVRRIVQPILRPVIVSAIGVVFVLSYRELGAVVLLVANNTVIVPYSSFVFWVYGGYPMLSALNMVTLVVPLALLLVAFGLNRGRPQTNDPVDETTESLAAQPAMKVV
jgi:iron(III) transport system permease protein